MAEFQPREPTGGASQRRGGIWTMFAGLQLFLFVFFVYLVGSTPPDARRTELALASVRDTFGGPGRPATDGPFEAGASALAELGGDLAASIRIAHVQRSARGTDLALVVPDAELFAPRDRSLRDSALPMLDRIIAALSVPPAGLRLLCTVTFDAGTDAAGERRATDRAVAMAAALLARGAPPTALAVGVGPVSLEPGGLGPVGQAVGQAQVRLEFRLAAPSSAGEESP